MSKSAKVATAMTQKAVTNRYIATKEALRQIDEECTQFLYATQTKYIPKIGYVHQLTMDQILAAKRFLDSLSNSSYKKEMEELEINQSEVEHQLTDKFLGVKVQVWESDLRTRIEEIRLETRIANLNRDLGILHRNLDDSSVRSIDLAQLSCEEV